MIVLHILRKTTVVKSSVSYRYHFDQIEIQENTFKIRTKVIGN